MSSFNKSIYEQLLSDKSFVEWASGRDVSSQGYWSLWKKEHLESVNEFDEAYNVASVIKFNPPEVSDKEVSYLWLKTKSRMHETPKAKPVQRLMVWYSRVAAVLIIPVILFSLWYLRSDLNTPAELADVIEHHTPKPVTVIAPAGGRLNFELPDGSKVWLNAGSEISYPVRFDISTREVMLKGEAVFEIEKDSVPFIVHNAGPDVKVYGTVFNVTSYSDNENVTVALVEGKISLRLSSEELFLKPGEVSIFNKQKRKISILNSKNIEKYVSWRDGRFIFRNSPLKEIVATLEHNYNVDISLSNLKIANYKYNATFENETLDHILYMLTLSAPIKYKYSKPKRNGNGEYSKAKVIIFEDNSRIINH